MRVYNYTFIMITMMLFLTFFGILGEESAFGSIFTLIGFNSDTVSEGNQTVLRIQNVSISTSAVYDALFNEDEDGGSSPTGLLIALGVALGSMGVGLFGIRASLENIIILPFITGTLTLFILSMASLMNYAIGTFPGWATAVIIIVFIPFTAGYILSLLDYFRGLTT